MKMIKKTKTTVTMFLLFFQEHRRIMVLFSDVNEKVNLENQFRKRKGKNIPELDPDIGPITFMS